MKKGAIGIILFALMLMLSACGDIETLLSIPKATPSPPASASPAQPVEQTLSIEPASPQIPTPGIEMDVAQIKAQMEERYSIELYFGKDCDLETPGYTYTPLADEQWIRKSLLLLDSQLAKYPKGIFIGMRLDKDLPFRFVLCTAVGINYIKDSNFGGVATNWDGYQVVFLNMTEDMWQQVPKTDHYMTYAINHEIGHAMFLYLENCAKGLPFDYYEWRKLQPKRFQYENQIIGEENYISVLTEEFVEEDDPQKIYFCDVHSKESLQEDIAALFGYSMDEHPHDFIYYPHIQDKIQYYFPLIRQVFGSDEWEETVYWEKVLKN